MCCVEVCAWRGVGLARGVEAECWHTLFDVYRLASVCCVLDRCGVKVLLAAVVSLGGY